MAQHNISSSLQYNTAWIGDDVARDIHRFNVFRVEDSVEKFDCKPYNRLGYFKISLHQGHNRLSDGNHVYEFQGAALVISSSDVVYGWEQLGVQEPCYFCVFTKGFFERFAGIRTYEVFADGRSPVIGLTESQQLAFTRLFKQMAQEITEDFHLKYDLLRVLVMQLILMAIKLRPAPAQRPRLSNATVRITQRFMELLEQQFPITSPAHRMAIRHPINYANKLAVHVNYLNRVLKTHTGKTTSQLISERTIRGAQELLTHTTWNVVEIAWCLGYEDVSHFIKSFKKYAGTIPTNFRKSLVA